MLEQELVLHHQPNINRNRGVSWEMLCLTDDEVVSTCDQECLTLLNFRIYAMESAACVEHS